MPPNKKGKNKGKAVASPASSSPRVTRSQASAANMAAPDGNNGESASISPLSSVGSFVLSPHDDEAHDSAVPSVHDDDAMDEDSPVAADRAPVAPGEQPRSPVGQQPPAPVGGEQVAQPNGQQPVVAPVRGEQVAQANGEQPRTPAGREQPVPGANEQRGSASGDRPRAPFVIPQGSPVIDLTLSDDDDDPKLTHEFTVNKRPKRDKRSVSPLPRGSGSSNTPRTPRRRGYGGGATCGAGPEYGGAGLQSGGILSSGGGSSGVSVAARESGGWRPGRMSKVYSDLPDSNAARQLFKSRQTAQEKAEKANAEAAKAAQRQELAEVILAAVLEYLARISAAAQRHRQEIRGELYGNAATLATNALRQELVFQSPEVEEVEQVDEEEDKDAEMKDGGGAE